MTSNRSATIAAFQRADELYRAASADGSTFWFLGNALHAGLRTLIASGSRDRTGLLQYGLEKFKAVVAKGTDGIWRDDFGWWGGAFCTAIRNRSALGYSDPLYDSLFAELLDQAIWCWTKLDGNWRDIAYSATIDHAVADADVVGGAFNVAPDESDAPVLAGRNSVTNAGFWLLSLELELLTRQQQYASRTWAYATWFQAWESRREAGEPAMRDARGLVLERPTGNASFSAWTWSGDQGAIALDSLRQLEKEMGPPYTNSLAAAIAIAVRNDLSVDGILTEDLAFRSEFDQFTVDYSTGKGICIRYLADVCAIIGPDWTQRELGTFIRANAASVWARRDQATGDLPFAWGAVQPSEPITGHEDIQALVFHMSALDVLSAATRFWPDAPIDGSATGE
ncbi:hypothetical protein [Agromyces allii]|uniref:Glycosyl hydrolase n=1 Tax=Agromyces allii TaxID=393607 RepID=A0ABP5C9L1_9MICO|nr:hypothetical protein [Agromyces allii]